MGICIYSETDHKNDDTYMCNISSLSPAICPVNTRLLNAARQSVKASHTLNHQGRFMLGVDSSSRVQHQGGGLIGWATKLRQ